jgi:hypothetical protein
LSVTSAISLRGTQARWLLGMRLLLRRTMTLTWQLNVSRSLLILLLLVLLLILLVVLLLLMLLMLLLVRQSNTLALLLLLLMLHGLDRSIGLATKLLLQELLGTLLGMHRIQASLMLVCWRHSFILSLLLDMWLGRRTIAALLLDMGWNTVALRLVLLLLVFALVSLWLVAF